MKYFTQNNFAATLQYGHVSAIDPATHKVKVSLPALENTDTDWLPVITMGAYGNQFYALPDVGSLVVCLLNATGDGGVVLGAMYNEADATPSSDGEMWLKRFKNGTVISHNRNTGQVLVQTDGDVIVKSAKSVTLDTPNTIITGNVQILGNTIVAGTMTAAVNVVGGGVSLKSHTHGGVAGGNSRTGTP